LAANRTYTVLLIEAEVPKLKGASDVPIGAEKLEFSDTSSPANGVTLTSLPSSVLPVTLKFAVEEAAP